MSLHHSLKVGNRNWIDPSKGNGILKKIRLFGIPLKRFIETWHEVKGAQSSLARVKAS